MKRLHRAAAVLALLAAAPAQDAAAQTCRARQIMTSQCTWFALEELGGSSSVAAKAQNEATSELIDGCSQGQYQMVLLRGTGLTRDVIERLRARGVRETAAIQAECAAEAARLAAQAPR